MIFLGIFLLELIVLLLLSRALTMHLSSWLYRLGMSERVAMHSLAILLLPGTFLHEFSHYLMSVVLRVKVYGMSLLPKDIGGGQIKMGTLEHAKTDLLRDLLIGAAPFILGNIILFFLLTYSTSHNPFGFNWTTLLVGLVVFEIGNTMFSSKKDMEGAGKFLLILTAIFLVAYLIGWRISIEQLDQILPASLINIIKQANIFLLLPIVIDSVLTIFLFFLNRVNN
jgi:uncharacterized membrane protein YiaA